MSTTPTQQSFHGTLPPRGLDATASSSISQGRFGRMFRHLPSSSPEDSSLADLAKAIIQPLDSEGLDKELGVPDDDENTAVLPGSEELRLPAGYTYFGQFVDHDITFDPVSSLTRQNDPDGLVDYRTPRFDLDSLYGRGPSDQPYLYESDEVHLALGREVPSPGSTVGHDLQRAGNGRALIGDPRNDENMIVSQLQATMIRFHNTVLDQVGGEHPNLRKEEVFKLAQQQVRWHYQWIVVHDFLARLVGDEVVADILKPVPYLAPGTEASIVEADLKFYDWDSEPFMPVEFSVGAYRFGHSMARPSYLINEIAHKRTPVEGVHRIPLFEPGAEPEESLSGFQPLPDQWTVQWRFFLPGIETAEHLPQPSYKIDTELSHPLGALPAAIAAPEVMGLGLEPDLAQVLAARNLFRAKRLGLPSGQDVALAMGIEPLSDAQLFEGENLQGLQQGTRDDLAGRAPLWFYILREAEVKAEKAHLGPVGGRIVAEVLIGLLSGDPLSFLGVRPDWKPTLPSATPGEFTLSDLVRFAIPTPESPPPPPPYGG
jgi:hypothetical protein